MDTPGEIIDDEDNTNAETPSSSNVQESGPESKEGEGRDPSQPPPSANGDMGPRVYERKIKNQEARLLARAVREGWNVPAEKKPAVVARMIRIVEDGIDRDAVSAARALVSMESQDMDARGEGKTSGNTTYNYTLNVMEAGAEAARLLQGQPLPPPPSVQPSQAQQ